MDREQRNRYIMIGVIAFCVVAASILLVFAIFKFEVIKNFCLMIWRILGPFLFGFILAYLLLPVYNFLLNLMQKLLCKRERKEKTMRRLHILANAIAVTCTMLFFLALVLPVQLRIFALSRAQRFSHILRRGRIFAVLRGYFFILISQLGGVDSRRTGSLVQTCQCAFLAFNGLLHAAHLRSCQFQLLFIAGKRQLSLLEGGGRIDRALFRTS